MLRQSRYASGNCPIADHDLARAYGFNFLIFKGIFANPADSRNGLVIRRKPVAQPAWRAFKPPRVATRGHRPEERRVGNECVSTCSYRLSPLILTTNDSILSFS